MLQRVLVVDHIFVAQAKGRAKRGLLVKQNGGQAQPAGKAQGRDGIQKTSSAWPLEIDERHDTDH